MNETIQKLLELINNNLSFNEISDILNLNRDELYQYINIINSDGYNLTRKYYYDGNIKYKLNQELVNDDKVAIITSHDLRKIKFLIISIVILIITYYLAFNVKFFYEILGNRIEILFSFINSFILEFSNSLNFLKVLAYFLEVTTAVKITDNIYLISFLLSFGGVCVWFQIMSIAKNFKINYLKFIFFRILQGALSVFFTKLLVTLFKISTQTFSNNIEFGYKNIYSTPTLTISLIVMILVFMVSIVSKKYAGKIIEDMI